MKLIESTGYERPDRDVQIAKWGRRLSTVLFALFAVVFWFRNEPAMRRARNVYAFELYERERS